KVLMLIDTNQLQITLDDLNKMTTYDYEMHEYAKEIDGVGIDFTLSVILKIVNDLKNKVYTKRNTIFDIIADTIKTPNDLLIIDGFFEECHGRKVIETVESMVQEEEEQEQKYELVKKDFKPRFSIFCDGRKAIIKGTNEPNLCKKSGFEFWWCENNKCYNACRHPKKPEYWKYYTLEDVLRILKIDYETKQYEIVLNVINRVNRFLEHLSCRSCKTILRPKNKSKYAFYGVTLFLCQNKECEKENEEIYLSHCLNGKCEDIIDGRDCVSCKNEGYDDTCGWYICNNCLACCSSEKLRARKYVLEEIMNLEYTCHLEGHLNRGVICCNKCGYETVKNKGFADLYQKQLDWFIQYKDTHPNISKYGIRKDGKYWFIWDQGNFTPEQYRKQLSSMLKSGFSIPKYN